MTNVFSFQGGSKSHAYVWEMDPVGNGPPEHIHGHLLGGVHFPCNRPTPLEDGHLLTSFFALLPNKSQLTYMEMWEAIKQLCPHAHPMHLLMDFEKAAANAFSHFWPNTLVKSCFFHLTQNIFRKIQAEGLQHEYQHNEDFALQMKLIPALAFAPPCDVLHLFGTVVQNLPMPMAEGLVLYFERTYIGRVLPGGTFQQPIFLIEMWNCHFEVLAGFPRTTNSVEAWHRSFNATLGCYHPTIWKFIQTLKLEQRIVELKQIKYLAGDRPTKRKNWQHHEETIRNLVRP